MTRVAVRLSDALARKLGLLESALRRATMSKLLAESDYSQSQASKDREWVDTPPAGDELV
jgi:predicted transcriptional regulator